MPVSVTMPRLGESVTEGTVTRWLKREGEHVDADEPLLEVSTDKVDTEVPSPATGTVLAIRVAEDETVEIGVELAVIGDADEGTESVGAPAPVETPATPTEPAPAPAEAAPAPTEATPAPAEAQVAPAAYEPPAEAPAQPASGPPAYLAPAPTPPADSQADGASHPVASPAPVEAALAQVSYEQPAPAAVTTSQAYAPGSGFPASVAAANVAPARSGDEDDDAAGPYVTPLVRKLASERGVDLATVHGTGVGGRIRKSDVLGATTTATTAATTGAAAQIPAPAEWIAPAHAAPAAQAPAAQAPAAQAPAAQAPAVASPAAASPAAASLRGRVEPMSRMRQVIAARMVESLQTSAQLTTVVEVDVTKIARLREHAKADFFAREGVKLSFLPFFAVATIEALKAHPVVNASIDMAAKTITYHDAEHLGIAVDTDRGLAVPVIHDAGDLNLAGIARKIADLAERTRANRISPDELGGGTFTLTNTGSRGALFDTPIINQPQVAILGTGSVVRRAIVISDDELGETIAIRSMVYLALSYDHRIVDGADAARFLESVKHRLETGAFERALGLLS